MPDLLLRKDPLWGVSCLGYSVQAQFDPASLSRLAALQADVLAACPAPLHATPPTTMHISVFPLVPVRSPDARKADLWGRIGGAALELIDRHAIPDAFTVTLEAVVLTETALIVSTPDQPEPIRSLRDRLNQLTVAAGQPLQRFDRTHVTLARPSQDARLDVDVVANVERVPARIAVQVSGLRVIRELVYPSLEIEPVRSIPM